MIWGIGFVDAGSQLLSGILFCYCFSSMNHHFHNFNFLGACRIKELPENGWISHLGDPNTRLYPNDAVPSFGAVNYRCIDNYLLENRNGEVIGDTDTNYCVNGVWRNPIPHCKPFCSTKSITGVTINRPDCSYNSRVVSCLDPPRPGTVAKIGCALLYESVVGNGIQLLTCGKDGRWSPAPTACTHKCGEEAPKGTPYVVGGRLANITQVPWHVGVYQLNNKQNGYEIACGGTIINAQVVITAMHCFWNAVYNEPYDASFFRVAAGKSFTDFIAAESLRQEQFQVKEILYVKDKYRDFLNNFLADVALAILDRPIEFHVGISPICMPYHLEQEEKFLRPNLIGTVAGYGLTSNNGQVSKQLKTIELPIVDRGECKRETQLELTSDKFCAGYLNLNIGVCSGDSGGGLVFPQTVNGKKKYFLRGIVSTGVRKDGSCDTNKYSTFTNILHYDDFIIDHATRNRPEI